MTVGGVDFVVEEVLETAGGVVRVVSGGYLLEGLRERLGGELALAVLSLDVRRELGLLRMLLRLLLRLTEGRAKSRSGGRRRRPERAESTRRRSSRRRTETSEP